MNATTTVAERKRENPIVRTQCFYDLKNNANPDLKWGQPKDYKKWGYSNETSTLK